MSLFLSLILSLILFPHADQPIAVASMEAMVPSVEATRRWIVLTAVPPLAWGANYYVTRSLLPADRPLWGAALRALPAGLVLLGLTRRLPSGVWWWRSAVLALLNTTTFFVLLYVASESLPTSVAASIMAASPLAMLLMAWVLAGQRPQRTHMGGAVVGLAGVVLMIGGGSAISVKGVAASAAAMLVSSVGYVLSARWRGGADVLSLTAWQLTAGGLMLLPIAVLAEGGPPALSPSVALGFGYATFVATALACALWFGGLRHLPAGTVGLLGLLNPVMGVMLGALVAGETFGSRQLCGLAMVIGGVVLGRPVRAKDRGVVPVHRASATGRHRSGVASLR